MQRFSMRRFPACLAGAIMLWLTTLNSGLAVCYAEFSARCPNVVFILVDDLGWADVKCFNDRTTYETPSVDRLAKQGMLFTNFYSAGPVCSPTRGSIMTGKYPARLRITRHLLTPKLDPPHMANHLELGEWTIAEAFKSGCPR